MVSLQDQSPVNLSRTSASGEMSPVSSVQEASNIRKEPTSKRDSFFIDNGIGAVKIKRNKVNLISCHNISGNLVNLAEEV
jgi:hypothetical protein